MADTPALGFEGSGAVGLDHSGKTSSIASDRSVLLARLEEAARAQRPVRCVYFGSSKVGAEREIIPIRIDPPDVWAHCVASGRRKRFRLGLIYILEPGEDPRWARPLEERGDPVTLPKGAPDARTLSQLIADYGEALDALGWRITLSGQAITLHRITDEAGGVVVALRQRDNGHWVVESLDKGRIKRRRLGAAAKIFLAAAERNARSAPASRPRRSTGRTSAWAILRFLGAAVFALVLGLTIGVLLPH
jgi:hypothetical protein